MQPVNDTIEMKASVSVHLLQDMQEIDLQAALTTPEHTFWRMANPSPEMLDLLSQRFALDELHIKDISNPIHPPHFTRLDNGAMHIILRFPVEKETADEISAVSSVSILVDRDMCALVWPGKRFHHWTLLGWMSMPVPARSYICWWITCFHVFMSCAKRWMSLKRSAWQM